MNANDLIAAIRTVVKTILSDIRLPQKAVVTSYDPTKHMAKVMLKPQELETSWLQIATTGVGSLFGLTHGLTPGDEVMVSFESGDINSGVITGALYNGQDLPTPTLPGEFKIVHPSGSSIKIFADGSIEIFSVGTLSLIATNLNIAGGGMTTSCSGNSIQNFNVVETYGPTTTVPLSPTFNPTVHAASIVKHPDT